MRWHRALLLILLVTSSAIAGCTTPPEGETEEDTTPDPGFGYVEIHLKRPINAERPEFDIWTLKAVPRLVAFVAGDNDTEGRIGSGDGYVSVARGWNEDWDGRDFGAEEYPEAAVRDWLQPHELWFAGQVPYGNYSVIRFELMELFGTHRDGTELELRVIGERLSIGPSESTFFEIGDGEQKTFVFDVLMERDAKYTYTIK